MSKMPGFSERERERERDGERERRCRRAQEKEYVWGVEGKGIACHILQLSLSHIALLSLSPQVLREPCFFSLRSDIAR
jgi:hypothetical protein